MSLDQRYLFHFEQQEVPELYEKSQANEETNEKNSKDDNSFEHLKLFESTIRCQHTELLLMYYRISFNLKSKLHILFSYFFFFVFDIIDIYIYIYIVRWFTTSCVFMLEHFVL